MADGRKLVAVQLAPSPAFLAAWQQVWQRGDALLPLRVYLPTVARDRLLASAGAHELWHESGSETLPHGMALDARTDLVVLTSGSTGRAKAVELSRGALHASAQASLERLEARPQDGWLCCLPLDHLAGLQIVLRTQLSGAPLVLHAGFDAAAVAQVIADGAVAFVSLVPTMLTRLLDMGAELSKLRAVLLGGAAAPEGLIARAREAGGRVVTSYGMTETAGGCVYDGVPLQGVKVSLDDDGHVRIGGATLFHGYRGDTRPQLDDGWFTTTDRGEFHNGRLHVLGRVDDIVVSGGENVSLAEVTALLQQHPGVAEAVGFGLDDAEWGQVVAAAIVPTNPSAPPTLQALRAHMATLAPTFMAPRRLVVLAELPRTGLGKIDGSALQRLAQETER